MNHPNREEWIGFAYGETDGAEKARLEKHLASCEACRSQLENWRTTMSALDRYDITPRAARLWRPRVVRWAAAAAILLAVGIFVGRASSSPAEMAQLRDRVGKAEAESARSQRLLLELSRTIAENHAQQQAALVSMAGEMAATRKDLETVATLTEAGLKRAQNQIVQLATYSESEPYR